MIIIEIDNTMPTNRGTSTDSLAIVMGCVGPPISFGLDISQNHVFNGQRQSRHFPRDVGLPTTPRFAQMLQNRSRFVLLDACDQMLKVRI